MRQLISLFRAVVRNTCRQCISPVFPALFILVTTAAFGQQNAGLGTSSPHPSALLDMTSTTQGLLVPRMTTAQRLAVAGPANGLLVFDTDLARFYFYHAASSSWIALTPGGALDSAVVLAPAASTRNTVQAASAGVVPLTLKGASGQTAELLSLQTSTSASVFSVGNSGNVVFSGALQPAGTPGQNGYLLQSQGTGQPPVWVDPSTVITGGTGASVSLPTGPAGSTLRYSGTAWVTSAVLLNNGTQIGINTAPTRTLDVNGTVRFGASGTTIANVIKTTVTATGNTFILPESSAGLTFTVPGAATSATVSVSPLDVLPNGVVIAYARVSAANTVEIRFQNTLSAVAITLNPVSYVVTVIE